MSPKSYRSPVAPGNREHAIRRVGLNSDTEHASTEPRALGAAGSISTPSAAPVLAASRFVLAGVVAGDSQQGATLISVDGKAAKPFVVGTRLGDEWFVKSVQSRRAVLVRADAAGNMPKEGGTELALDMPLPIKGANPNAALAPVAP